MKTLTKLTYILSFHVSPEVPRITVVQQVVLVSVGGDAVLECQVTGVPPPVVHWFKGKLQSVNASQMTGKVRDRQTYTVCFQVSSTWGLLLLSNRMCAAGPCTFEAPSRLTLASTAVWPAALLEPPLRLLL